MFSLFKFCFASSSLYHRSLGRFLMNQNKSVKLKTCKTYQKETNFFKHRDYLKARTNFLIALPTDQLLIHFHDKQYILVDICGSYRDVRISRLYLELGESPNVIGELDGLVDHVLALQVPLGHGEHIVLVHLCGNAI